jgi:hypothetical protein
MIPSIFDYLPGHAQMLFEKVAATSIRETDPEVVAPDVPAEPRIDPMVVPPDKPPPHPYLIAAKQLLPIGIGTAAGYAAGLAGPYMYEKYVKKVPTSIGNYHAMGGIGAAAGGIGGLAATIMSQARQAEADRANQEYKDYFARRAGSPADPSVQPPPVRP